jgi:alkanesulfonate monooxygenase SsuD/methylene tetrahydromethanopterin reductase-like flavin-dependent oxidoreductase (luciferase family)
LTVPRISLMLPGRADSPQSIDQYIRYAQLAEASGFYMATLGHHSFGPDIGDPSAPFVALAAIARETSTIRLGTGVYLSPLHHPVTVMEQAATLDQVSNGRAVLGVGLGWLPEEYEGFGLDYGARAARMEEGLMLMRTAWETGTFPMALEHFPMPDLPVFPPCVQEPHMPMLVGGSAPAALERAGRLGDGLFALPQEGMAAMKGQIDIYREASRKAGHKPYVCLMRQCWIGDSADHVAEAWMPRLQAFYSTFANARDAQAQGDDVLAALLDDQPVSFEEFAAGRLIGGTPDMCRQSIEDWRDHVGFDELVLIFNGSEEPAELERAIQMFGETVIAQLT